MPPVRPVRAIFGPFMALLFGASLWRGTVPGRGSTRTPLVVSVLSDSIDFLKSICYSFFMNHKCLWVSPQIEYEGSLSEIFDALYREGFFGSDQCVDCPEFWEG